MSELTVAIHGDLSGLLDEETRAKRILDGVNKEIKETESKLRSAVRKGFRLITSLIGTMRSVASTFGIAIPPIFDAILTAVTSTVMAMHAIAAAYAAGIVTAAIAIPLEAAAIALSWTAVLMVAVGRSDIEHGLSQMEGTLRSIGYTVNAVERVAEGF